MLFRSNVLQDVDARIHVPTQEVQLMGQTLNTFLALPTHLVKHLLEQVFHFAAFKNY